MTNGFDASDYVILRHVSKKFGNFQALDDVSFSIKEGQIFGYIGPNGAGKTTTMKILVGLLGDFEGDVQIGGINIIKEKHAAHELLGYLPQNVAFQDWRTVNQALTTFGKLSGLNGKEVNRNIMRILDLLNLSDVKHKKISQLSGGTIQRVGLAQALLHEPKLLVLDEPLGGLDPLSRNQFKDIVLQLKKAGSTILFSSHILSDVQDVADQIGIISHGKIKQIGSLNDLQYNLGSQKVIEILLASETNSWVEFDSIMGVKDVEKSSPGRILLHLEVGSDETLVINEVVQVIVKSKIQILGVRLLSPSLDQIYLNYVQDGNIT